VSGGQFTMPPEWYPHERTWMAWPTPGYTLGEDSKAQLEARTAWASVANAIVDFEPVTMLCEKSEIAHATSLLDPKVEILEAELNDAWMRDIGPTFVHDSKHTLVGVNWIFNGWGAQPWATWDKDSKIASFVSNNLRVEVENSWLINEGGGLHVNGDGVVLLTETVQLGEGRNSGKSKSEVEKEIHRLLGTSQAIWLKRGLTRDYDEFGTRGHIDIVACFANANTILYHDQQDSSHPDFEVTAEIRSTLEAAGNFNLIPLPAPKVLRDEEGWVDYSYINHYVVNGAVILCAFEDENDQVAKSILEKIYPDREVILVDSRAIFARGGGIHCITQQQPTARISSY
jgi:agmatine deiminase